MLNSSLDCHQLHLLGDGYCHDETNNADCSFDGGDCCGSCINTDYCTTCSCIGNVTVNGVSNALVGNGYCNDEMNTEECNFDGGDCCGLCETITITMENNAKVAEGIIGGIYHNSSIVNGKPSWTSTYEAIWYHQPSNSWNIGSLYYIGTITVGIYSSHGSQCPFHLSSEMWNYWVGNGWTNAGPNVLP